MTDEQVYSTFETELQVRPDDIDMFRHVHNSKYLDYVLAARYLQMEHCYGMGMDKFLALGYGWVVKTVQVDFKRPLMMGDIFIVKTGIIRIDDRGCRVGFTITLKKTNKVSADGWFDFVMIDLKTGKSLLIPQEIKQHYEV